MQEALRHFLAEIEAGAPVPRADVYTTLGRGEMRAGRSLESLLSAYRVGARVAWRRFAAVGVAAGLEPETLYLLAESIFAYIDVLSAESAEGHALEQSAAAGEAELRRRRLVRACCVREQPAEVQRRQAAAQRGPLAAAAHARRARDRRARSASPPRRTSAAPTRSPTRSARRWCAMIPDPDGPGRRAALERAIREAGATAGLGTTVGWGNAARQLRPGARRAGARRAGRRR